MLDFLKRIFTPPASVPAQPAPQPAPGPPEPKIQCSVPSQSGDAIQVPFSDIMARLPGTLAPLVLSTATGTFPLSVKTALAQLPSGAVRVRFAELRQAAAPGTFADNPSLDETLVDLPLPKILAGINPALLARRSGQTQVEVPEEISGIFGSKTTAPAQAVAPGAPPLAPKSEPVVLQKPPATIAFPAGAPLPFVAQKPAGPAPAAVPQASTGGTLTVRLSALCEFWPEPVRQDIAQSNWSNASVALPMNRLDAAMKTGRVAFAWGELIQWLDVSSATFSSPHRETSLELPLKVIAPLFMSERRASVVQKDIVVGENIPNMFAVPGKPSGQTAPVVAPAPIPVPVPVAAPAPVIETVSTTPVTAAAPASVLGEIFGRPEKKEWSPQEITQEIDVLPGVAASLIAMSDGLLVAGEMPPPLKSETMAAFLPQMFGRLAHYSGEIQLGPVTALTLLAGQTPCTIFKTGGLYLAVLGKPGERLPDALLQRVAGELAKRNQ